MSLFDKAKKKKDKEKEFLDLGEDLEPKGGDYGPAGMETPVAKDEDMGLSTPPIGPSPMHSGSAVNKDIEIINSKLSALKSEIEALRQRVRFIENKLNLGEKEDLAHKYGTSAPKDTGWHY